mmetsp:Transcript_13431/g.47351  ORF Transcript_13431/g.47351 Transcript_13431/m.47351 type:complete len:269 (-) Transcript_13431:746-1552(-)
MLNHDEAATLGLRERLDLLRGPPAHGLLGLLHCLLGRARGRLGGGEGAVEAAPESFGQLRLEALPHCRNSTAIFTLQLGRPSPRVEGRQRQPRGLRGAVLLRAGFRHVLLLCRLGEVKRTSYSNLGGHVRVAVCMQHSREGAHRSSCGNRLSFLGAEDSTPVLGSLVSTLLVPLRRVVARPELPQQVCEGEPALVPDRLHGLAMLAFAGGYIQVGGIHGIVVATNESHRGAVDTRKPPKALLDTPEASSSKPAHGESIRIWRKRSVLL